MSKFLQTVGHDLATIWRGLSRPLRLSAGLAATTAMMLLIFALIGPASMRLGAAIGLVALLIVMQITIMLLLISGQLIPANVKNPQRQQVAHAITTLRTGDFPGAVQAYRQCAEDGVSVAVIGAFFGLACYLNDDRVLIKSVLQKSLHQIPSDPARAWLISVLCIICQITPPGSESEGILYDIIAANPEGRSVWRAEAERYPGTLYGERLTALLMQADRLLVDHTP